MGHIKISIVIPIYNVEHYIGRCVESVLNQKLSKDEYEVIFVNDGTKDNSVEVLNKAIDFEKYKNLHIYNKENGGLSSARNFGLDKAHGDYVWFVDSDDWIEPNCLAKIVKKLNEIFVIPFLKKYGKIYPAALLKPHTKAKVNQHKPKRGGSDPCAL